MVRARQAMARLATDSDSKPASTSTPAAAVPVPTATPNSSGVEGGEGEGEGITAPSPSPVPQPPAQAKPGEAPPDPQLKGKPGEKQPSSWQLVEKYKRTAKTLEAEAADLRKQLSATGDVKGLLARVERAETDLKATRERLAYHDYREDPAFQKEYVEPLTQAWIDAGDDLKEFVYTDEDGESRPATMEDISKLANMSLGEAKRVALERFGDLANEAMAHRNKIVDLFRKQQRKLDEIKKTAGERKQAETFAQQQAREEVGNLWANFAKEDAGRDSFLQEREGDDEWNARLQKSGAYVEAAFTRNPLNPNLTPDQRQKVVRDHANIRARAKAHPMLVIELGRKDKEIAQLKQQLAQYKGGEPPPGDAHGSPGEAGAGAFGSAMQRSLAALRRKVV
jgi:hypothetical protein